MATLFVPRRFRSRLANYVCHQCGHDLPTLYALTGYLAADIVAARALMNSVSSLYSNELDWDWKQLKISVKTNKLVAYDSPDHVQPWGTMRDNSVNFGFNRKLLDLVKLSELSVLDLGCSGGGFVKSIHEMGCLGVGIEGSDYSKKRKRAEWATIPDYLFTADISEPFSVVAVDRTATVKDMRFSVVTAWEVLEHLNPRALAQFWLNLKRHLADDGLFIGSISTIPDVVNGVSLHQTVQPQEWWHSQFIENGFKIRDELVAHFGMSDWVRWSGNPFDPLVSFNVVASIG